jgi:hypothetical protein
MRKADKERAKEERSREKAAVKREKEVKASAASEYFLKQDNWDKLISRTAEEWYSIKTFACYFSIRLYSPGYQSVSID